MFAIKVLGHGKNRHFHGPMMPK